MLISFWRTALKTHAILKRFKIPFRFTSCLFNLALLASSFYLWCKVSNSYVHIIVFLSAPLAGVLVNRFGWRIVTFGGGILTCAGLLLSTVSTNLAMLCLFYGIVTGYCICKLVRLSASCTNKTSQKSHENEGSSC